MEFKEDIDFYTEMLSGKILEMYVILCAECGGGIVLCSSFLLSNFSHDYHKKRRRCANNMTVFRDVKYWT